jgi:hypothetical protein
MGVVFALSPNRISLPRYDCQVDPHDNLFEVCTAFTCVAACTLALPPIRDTLSEGFSHFVSSMTAPVASGWSEFAGWGFHPLESAAFARRTSIAVMGLILSRSRLTPNSGPAETKFGKVGGTNQLACRQRSTSTMAPTLAFPKLAFWLKRQAGFD